MRAKGRFLSAVLKRTRTQTKRWGLLIAVGIEVFALVTGILVRGLSWDSVADSAVYGLIPIAAFGLAVFLWNMISEPHRRLRARICTLETSPSLQLRDKRIESSLQALKGCFLRLIKNFRHLPRGGHHDEFKLSRHSFDRSALQDLDQEIRFYVGETRSVAKLYKSLEEWYWGKDEDGMSIVKALQITYVESAFSKEKQPSLSSRYDFLQKKMIDLQEIAK
ncbi:MAG: hypothetical protein OXJ55_06315 [Caldilineaceae bacterium]|nr:hypothetical protein [Caldilineaceae bacterium]